MAGQVDVRCSGNLRQDPCPGCVFPECTGDLRAWGEELADGGKFGSGGRQGLGACRVRDADEPEFGGMKGTSPTRPVDACGRGEVDFVDVVQYWPRLAGYGYRGEGQQTQQPSRDDDRDVVGVASEGIGDRLDEGRDLV